MKKTSILSGLVIVSSLALAPMVASAQSDGPQGLAHGANFGGSSAVGGVASTIGAVLGNFHAADKSGNDTVAGLHGKLGAQAISRGADNPHDGQ